MNCGRRAYLGLLAGAAAGTAGCVEGDDGTPATGDASTQVPSDTPTRTPTVARSPTATATDARTATRTGTARTQTTSGGSLTLDVVDPTELAELTVFPGDLASMLRDAAHAEAPIRTRADASVYDPEPTLPAFETVELVDETGDGSADGVYSVDCDGGTSYQFSVAAEEATPPEDTAVKPVSDFRSEFRDLVVSAIDGEDPYVAPHTERGQWVREQALGTDVEYEGATYRIYELKPTDAEFFSTQVWYVCRLEPADGDPDATLRLRDLSAVRETVQAMLDDRKDRQASVATEYDAVPESAAAFADGTAGLLTHAESFSVSVTRTRDA